ncbi:hypothetical protein EML15_03475 [Corynebacterium sp. sy017]|uniref:hypothetical protein n=1 Tax=unclassified Corynebacterium TaxID=2624378 RepID=UPI0011869B7F|nr:MULTISPECIES: hypothetical protein [unclassified Corynebacterium]MBP3088209.1 hypothetical protein [Corynebacterium sp. sy017]TSD91543.1 hypothetical protein ELY17_03475 [Corynebacterium sp. SY003]
MRKRLMTALSAGVLAASTLHAFPAQAASYTEVNPGVVGGSCSREGMAGQELTITGSTFEVEGTATVANYNDEDLPLTQTIREGKTKNWNVGGTVSFDLLKLINVSLSAGYSSTQTWEVGQTLGPYPVKPGYTGVLEYGFLISNFEGKNLRCQGGQWVDTGRPFWGNIPKERHVRVSMRSNDV